MNEIDRITDQMTRAFTGEAWHGPALLEVLDGVDAPTAAARPIARAHSIWEIVLHLIATQTQMLRRMTGDATELTPEEDWPTITDSGEVAWRDTLETLQMRERSLRQAVIDWPVDKLDQPPISGGSSAYNNFHGHVQHNLYHAGQIILLSRVR